MATLRMAAAGLFLAGAAVSVFAQAGEETGLKPGRYEAAEAFIADPANAAAVAKIAETLSACMKSGAVRERGELATLESFRETPFAVFEELCRRIPTSDAPRSGRSTIPFTVAADGKTSTCAIVAPPDYDPAKKWPVFLAMHGHASTSEPMIHWFSPWAAKYGFILAAPLAHTEYANTGWASTEPERSNPISALEEVKKLFNVDPDRVVLSGCCMGGHGSWETAMLYGDRFCAVYPTIGGPRIITFAYVENLLDLPMYTYVGLKDQPFLVWNIQRAVKTLNKAGGFARCAEYPEKGHDIVYEEDGPFFEWLSTVKRESYPKKIVWHANKPEHRRAWWAEIEEFDGKPFDPYVEKAVKVPPGRGKKVTDEELRELYIQMIRRKTPGFTAEIKPGNRISVRAQGLARMTFYLSDRMLDLDSKVVVEINGKTRFSGIPARSLEFLVRHVVETRDTGRVFACKVSAEAR